MHAHYKLNIKIHHDTSWTDDKLNKSSFSLDPDGIWLYNTNNYYVTTEDAQMLGLGGNLQETLDIQDKTIYRYPKLALPRQKMDLLKDSYNIKITRDKNKADIHVVSIKFIESIIEVAWKAALSKRQMYNVLVKLREEDLLHDDLLDSLRMTLQDTDENDYFTVDTPYSYHNISTNEAHIKKVREIVADNKAIHLRCALIQKKDSIDIYNALTSTSALIVLDTDITKKVSESLNIITAEDYQSLYDQLNSNDIETRSLALELMSNSNFEESFDILAMLFYFNFDWCKATNNWNTVNVKTFKNRFKGLEGGCQQSTGRAYNRLLAYLAKEDKLTEFVIQVCKEKIIKKVLPAAGLNDSLSFSIKIEDINIDKEYNDYIKKTNIIKEQCIQI
jgi:hypothetical protein